VIWPLAVHALQTVSAALFLVYYVELLARHRNMLLRRHWGDLGAYAIVWHTYCKPLCCANSCWGCNL
jgi:hypothetical protein